MGIYLNKGNDLFKKRLNSSIYVDKTGLIELTNQLIGTDDQYVSVSRPRRFGKSMTGNMLAAYYSKGCDSYQLFSDLKIAQSPTFEQHLNQYNVIHLTMTDFAGNTVEEAVKRISNVLIKKLKKEYPEVDYIEDQVLSSVLDDIYEETGIAFIFIIDEWDFFMRSKGYSEKDKITYLSFLRALLKDKSYVALAYITGIFPVKKYGEQSALNMFAEYSMENQGKFAPYTGFTEDEVKSLCETYEMDFEETKRWYDGYEVNKMAIYNPQSVVRAMNDHAFSNYWTKTENYESLKNYIQTDFDGLRQKVELLITGEKISVNTDKFQNDLSIIKSEDDVLTLLIHLGYLTYNFEEKNCWIPNYEIQTQFINCIEDGGWENLMAAINTSKKCLQATLDGDSELVATLVEKVHQENISLIKYNDENSLSLVVTLAYYYARNEYIITREEPAGKGYADIIFRPRKYVNKPAMIVELKKNKSSDVAIAQIKERGYMDALKEYRGEVVLVGISYNEDAGASDYKKHMCTIENLVVY